MKTTVIARNVLSGRRVALDAEQLNGQWADAIKVVTKSPHIHKDKRGLAQRLVTDVRGRRWNVYLGDRTAERAA